MCDAYCGSAALLPTFGAVSDWPQCRAYRAAKTRFGAALWLQGSDWWRLRCVGRQQWATLWQRASWCRPSCRLVAVRFGAALLAECSARQPLSSAWRQQVAMASCWGTPRKTGTNIGQTQAGRRCAPERPGPRGVVVRRPYLTVCGLSLRGVRRKMAKASPVPFPSIFRAQGQSAEAAPNMCAYLSPASSHRSWRGRRGHRLRRAQAQRNWSTSRLCRYLRATSMRRPAEVEQVGQLGPNFHR